MGLIDKFTKKLAKTASEVVTDSVKTEAKNVAVNALPVLVGLGLAIAGFVIFKSSTTKVPTQALHIPFPSISTTSMVTNNWFLDEASKAEVLTQFLKNQK